MANTKVTSSLIADNAIGIDQLNVSDGTNGQALVTDGAGTLSFSTIQGYTDSDVETYLNTSEIYTDPTNNRLGIGTNSPDTNLHIGSGTTGENLGVKLNRGSTTNFFVANDGTKSAYIGVDAAQGYMKMGSLTDHPVSISQNNGTAIYIDTSKNVGIGTTTTFSNPLTLNKAAGAAGSLNNQLALTHTGASTAYYIKTIRASADDEPVGLAFMEHLTERMRINPSGNVGIGTDDPGAKLDIRMSDSNGTYGRGLDGNLNLENTNTSVTEGGWLSISGYMGNATSRYTMGAITGGKQTTAADGDYGGYLSFWNTSGGANGEANSGMYERMRIDSRGNIGAGISTIEQLGSDSVYPRIQSYSSATSGHFCGLMIGRPNSAGLESSIAFTVGGIMVGKIQHDYVASNHNDMSFHLRGASGDTDLEVMRLWAGSGADTALLVGRTTRSWVSAKLEVESNARIGNLYFTGSGSDSTISAGNANYKFSTATVTCGATGLDFDVNVVVTGVGITNRFKVDSPTGDTYTNDGTISSLSDIRVKTDINNLTDGLEIVKQLRPVTFKYNDDSTDDDGNSMLAAADDKIRYGFIAQEVEAVAPHYVETSTRKINNEEVNDFKSLSTTRMIPMLFKAIQEQQTIIDDLKARIETLEG